MWSICDTQFMAWPRFPRASSTVGLTVCYGVLPQSSPCFSFLHVYGPTLSTLSTLREAHLPILNPGVRGLVFSA